MIPDKIIDSLQFYWNTSNTPGPWTHNGPRMKDCPYRLHLLEDALTLQYWEIHLDLWCALVAHCLSRRTFRSVLRTTGLKRENLSSDKIILSDHFAHICISEEAFERLMNRYFKVILPGIPRYKKKWLSSHRELWSNLVKIARLLRRKHSKNEKAELSESSLAA